MGARRTKETDEERNWKEEGTHERLLMMGKMSFYRYEETKASSHRKNTVIELSRG